MASVARKYNINNNQLRILPTGLGILAQIYSHHLESNNNSINNNNIVLKSGLRSLAITSSANASSSVISSSIITNEGDNYYNSQLKSCHLCTKSLRPDQDIYMYRGDQGFCSKECRNRQIMLDERREKEAQVARKKIASNTLSSFNCRGCETCRLLEELRRQRRGRKNSNCYNPKNQPIFSLS